MIDDSAFGVLWASATECAKRLRPLGHQTPGGALQDVVWQNNGPFGESEGVSQRMQGRSEDPADSGLLVLGGSRSAFGLIWYFIAG